MLDLMLPFSLLHCYGNDHRDPEKRGRVMCGSSFQLGLSRWKQEMRNSDKHYMPCILCNKFIGVLSCCVYVQNQSPSNFRSTICFMFGISTALCFVPCGTGM